MGESSKSPTTKAFARVFMKVRMGSDSMASQILKDSEIQIIKTVHLLRSILADLISYCRESWKADVRRIVLPELSPGVEGHGHRDEMIRAIRRGFANRMPGKPWYPSLVEEIADEELAEDAQARREKVLASLTIAAPVQVKTVEAPDGKTILLEAVRLLSRPNEELATAIAVLEENERLLTETRSSGGGWLRRLFGSSTAPKSTDRVYKVEYAEPGVPTPKTETIDFPAFSGGGAEEVEPPCIPCPGDGPGLPTACRHLGEPAGGVRGQAAQRAAAGPPPPRVAEHAPPGARHAGEEDGTGHQDRAPDDQERDRQGKPATPRVQGERRGSRGSQPV